MTTTIVKPTIRVLTYAGAGEDVQGLARCIRHEVSEEMAAVDADRVVGTIEFDEHVVGVDALAGRLADGRDTILHLVSHAGHSGAIAIEDIWGNLRLEPSTLAEMVGGSGVNVVMISACHGAGIAKTLLDARAVGVAVGYTEPVSMGAAVQMSRGFYRSLIQGNSPLRAAADGDVFAKPRVRKDGGTGELKIWRRASGHPDDPLFGAQFHIIGTPIAGCADALDALIKHLAPYEVTQSEGLLGDDTSELEWKLRNARVVIALVDDEPVTDSDPVDLGAFLEQVTAAVERARLGKVRVVPTFLAKGVARAPFGLKRLQPAFLHRGYGGSPERLAQALKKALEKDLKRR